MLPSSPIQLFLQLAVFQRAIPHRSKAVLNPVKQTSNAVLGEGNACLPQLNGGIAMGQSTRWDKDIQASGKLDNKLEVEDHIPVQQRVGWPVAQAVRSCRGS